jgi:hypothetical protein
VYKVFSYFKREADAIYVILTKIFLSVPPAFVRVGHFSNHFAVIVNPTPKPDSVGMTTLRLVTETSSHIPLILHAGGHVSLQYGDMLFSGNKRLKQVVF